MIKIWAKRRDLYRIKRTFIEMLGEQMLSSFRFHISPPGGDHARIQSLTISVAASLEQEKAVQLLLMILRLSGDPHPRQVFFLKENGGNAEFIRRLA